MTTSYCKNNHILIGLGGTGGKILKAFKMRMFEELHDSPIRDKQPVSLLYVDSTTEMMGIGRPDFRVMGMDASFTQSEFLNIKGVDVDKILDNNTLWAVRYDEAEDNFKKGIYNIAPLNIQYFNEHKIIIKDNQRNKTTKYSTKKRQ